MSELEETPLAMAESQLPPDDDDETLQLVEERVVVSKVEVETGRVRVSTHVEERTERVCESLRRQGVDVQRVRLDRYVETEPSVREEDGVLILPVVEEVLVKRFLLKEEVRITRTSTLEAFERDVTLRALSADVERIAPVPQPPKE